MNIFQNNKMTLKWLEGQLIWFHVKIEQEKSILFMKSHEMTNFTSESKALNPIVGSGCNFTWSLLICFPTLVKDHIPIGVE
jgi:hypothetical protein